MVAKEQLLHNFAAKGAIKNKKITVAGRMFVKYERVR